MANPDVDGIIQRMIDAGESEENVGLAYQALMAESAASATPVAKSAPGMGTDPIANLTNRVSPGTGDWLEGAGQGFVEGVNRGAKGFVKGVIPGAVSAVTDLPTNIYNLGKGAVDAAVGGYNLVTDTKKTAHGAIDAISGIPGKIKDSASVAATKAAVDPEGFGKDVGNLTGYTAASAAGSYVVPMAPKPIARKIGALTEQVGTKGAWPIRMMGAHQLGSGNPMGIVTMGSPEMLQKTGRKLQEFGAPPSQATGGYRLFTDAEKAEMAAKAKPSEPVRYNTDGTPVGTPAHVTAPENNPKPIRILGKAAQDLADGRGRTSAPVGPATMLERNTGGAAADAAGVLDAENARRLATGDVGGGPAARAAVLAPEAPRPAKVATQQAIPASKSKKGMSATPGLTVTDLESVGLKGNMNYTNLTPELIAKIKANRSSRHQTNYSQAQSDKHLRSLGADILESSLLLNPERLR